MAENDELQVDQDLGYQRKEWLVQRLAGIAAGVVIALAIAGVFGTGPVSWTTATGADGRLSVDFERFVRHTGEAELHIHVVGVPDESEITFWVDRGYLDRFEITAMVPAPQKATVLGERVLYTYPTGGGDPQLDVAISVRPTGMGRQHGRVGVPGAGSVGFWQFSFP